MTLGSGENAQSQQQQRSTLVTSAQNKRSRRTICRSDQHYLLSLPDDVLYVILSFCDTQSLGRLACVCRRLLYLVSQDFVWLDFKKSLTQIRDSRWRHGIRMKRRYGRLSVREQCRCYLNWERGHCRSVCLIHHGVKQMPCMQLDNNLLWITYKSIIRCYRQQSDGYLKELTNKTLRGHQDDVGRFVVKDNMVVSGSRDRSIRIYSSLTGQPLAHLRNCHTGDIQAVDTSQDIIVSGSRDATVKIWNIRENSTDAALQKTIAANDRVWSIAMNPNGRSFATGTAGINYLPPLRIWDTESSQQVAVLGDQYKYGAGVLDIHYETQDVLLTCGYDTITRLWDLRTSHTYCVMMWEEPFDSTLYCVRSDGNHSVVTGTARHGLVRLWDKRRPENVQLYYCGRSNTPVYSLAFDTGHMYVGLDKGIYMLDFTIPG